MGPHTFDTCYGEVTFKHAMIDTDGTNLEEGITIFIDGKYIAETIDFSIDEIEEMTEKEIESVVETYCEDYI